MRTLTREEIDTVLHEIGYGYLGLADDGRPYVIPLSFGYDGETLFFQMNSGGRKSAYIEDGARACFTAVRVAVDAPSTTSVIVEGALESVPEEDSAHAMQVLAKNGEFGTDFDIWGDPLQKVELREIQLVPTEISGRSFR